MPPARYANAPISLISLNYNLNYERALCLETSTPTDKISIARTNFRADGDTALNNKFDSINLLSIIETKCSVKLMNAS